MDPIFASAREALLCRREAIERGARERAAGGGAKPRRARPSAAAAPAGREGFTDAERREVEDIDAALARIAKGSYGHCERCGVAIGHQRLRAVPEGRHCGACSPDPEGRRP